MKRKISSSLPSFFFSVSDLEGTSCDINCHVVLEAVCWPLHTRHHKRIYFDSPSLGVCTSLFGPFTPNPPDWMLRPHLGNSANPPVRSPSAHPSPSPLSAPRWRTETNVPTPRGARSDKCPRRVSRPCLKTWSSSPSGVIFPQIPLLPALSSHSTLQWMFEKRWYILLNAAR